MNDSNKPAEAPATPTPTVVEPAPFLGDDHVELTRRDLEFRARQAGVWGLPDAKAATARAAMAWAQEVLGIPEPLKSAAKTRRSKARSEP